MTRTFRNVTVGAIVTLALAGIGWTASADQAEFSAERADRGRSGPIASEVLDWNQIFIDTLIATNTANAASPRLGATLHTAIFDAYNGIDRRYTPLFVTSQAPHGASRRAAVIGAAHTALVGLFPSRQPLLLRSYDVSKAALIGDCEGGRHSARRMASCISRIDRGIAWLRERGVTVEPIEKNVIE